MKWAPGPKGIDLLYGIVLGVWTLMAYSWDTHPSADTCANLGKFFSLSVLSFLYLYNGKNEASTTYCYLGNYKSCYYR